MRRKNESCFLLRTLHNKTLYEGGGKDFAFCEDIPPCYWDMGIRLCGVGKAKIGRCDGKSIKTEDGVQ